MIEIRRKSQEQTEQPHKPPKDKWEGSLTDWGVEPIETVYKGYRFRSRAEARWAIFLDELGIKWYYEPEGFKFLNGVCYLPDFYLPDQDCILEIKGVMTGKDYMKINSWVKEGLRQAVIGYPDLTFEILQPYPPELMDENDASKGVKEPVADLFHMCDCAIWKCRKCGKVYFKQICDGWQCECCGFYDGDRGYETIFYGADYELGHIPPAMQVARSARFEHGEKP